MLRLHRDIARIAAPLALLLGLTAAAGGAAPSPLPADTSPQARRQAIAAMPLDKLSPAARAKAETVLGNVSVFRRMPIRVVDCDPEMYLFLLRHPDVAVNIWEVLGISQLRVDKTAEGAYAITDNAGTRARLELLYQSHDTHVVYAEGSYEGPLCVRPIPGRVLLLLRNGYVRETDGRYYITTRLDSFLSLEPGAVELVTKTLQPIMGKVADANFIQTLAFAGSLSRTAEVNRSGVERLAGRLERIDSETREGLVGVAARVSDRFEARLTAMRPDEGMTR